MQQGCLYGIALLSPTHIKFAPDLLDPFKVKGSEYQRSKQQQMLPRQQRSCVCNLSFLMREKQCCQIPIIAMAAGPARKT